MVRGLRTNLWFEFTYDRANVPKEVEKLYEITGAYLEWFMPEVNGRQIAHSEYGHYFTSQAVIGSFHVAASAPLAVSSGVNGLMVWNLAKGTAAPLLFMKGMPNANFEGPWNTASISPDGNIIAYASQYATYAMDWKAEKILWQKNSLGGIGYDNKIAIGGDKGQFLFIAAVGQIERWDLATGRQLAVLATNQPTIHFLGTSRDGKVLVVGFSGMESWPTSITVWKSGEDKPSASTTLPESSGVGILPDGRRIAFSVFGQKSLKIWDWQNDTIKEIPFRLPYASSHAYSIFWSPDKTRFAAYVDTYPSSIVVYDALNWKPLAHWKCGQVMSDAKFDFASDGEFVELRDHDLTGLDVKSLSESK